MGAEYNWQSIALHDLMLIFIYANAYCWFFHVADDFISNLNNLAKIFVRFSVSFKRLIYMLSQNMRYLSIFLRVGLVVDWESTTIVPIILCAMAVVLLLISTFDTYSEYFIFMSHVMYRWACVVDDYTACDSEFDSDEYTTSEGEFDSDEYTTSEGEFDSDQNPTSECEFDSDEYTTSGSEFDIDENNASDSVYDSD